MSAAVLPAIPPVDSTKLTGLVIGTTGSYRNQGNSIANVFDGNPSTYFDSPTSTGWVGLDLGAADIITQVQYVPRSGKASRMTGGQFQGSDTPDFSADVTTLCTISSTPASNAFSVATIANATAFRYVRYLAPAASAGNVAELEFDGKPSVVIPTESTTAVANSATDVTVTWSTSLENAADSFTVYRQGPKDIAPIAIAFSPANSASYDDTTVVPSTPYSYQVVPTSAGQPLTTLAATIVTTPAIPITPIKLTGNMIGTASSYRNLGHTISGVFDGNTSTYFDAPVGNNDWVGLDFLTPQSVTQIKFAPRANYASRMVGGMFQVSNTEDFSAGVITIDTITSAPTYKGLTTVNVVSAGGFRYARYLSPNGGCGNIAELEFDGLPASTATLATDPVTPSAFPSTITWTNAAASPIVRAEAVGASVNGVLYVFGGFDNEGSDDTSIPLQSECDSFNPATNTWTRLNSFPEPFTHSEEVVVGTSIWFIGGYIGNHPGPGTTHVWVYDTTNDIWSRGPDLPQARGAGAAALIGKTIYFAGGMDETRTIDESSAYSLDVTNLSAGWTQIADLPNGRNHVAAAALGSYFYVIGGQHGQEDGQAAQDEVDRYDPSSNAWTQIASLPTAAGKSHITDATFAYDGRLVVVGGETGYNDPQRYIVDYDPSTNTWNQLGLLPAARSTAVAGIINGQLVVTTGNSPVATTTTWIGSFS